MKAVWNPSPRATSTSLDFSGMFASPRRELGEDDGGEEERVFSLASPIDFVNVVNRQGRLRPSHLETRRYQQTTLATKFVHSFRVSNSRKEKKASATPEEDKHSAFKGFTRQVWPPQGVGWSRVVERDSEPEMVLHRMVMKVGRTESHHSGNHTPESCHNPKQPVGLSSIRRHPKTQNPVSINQLVVKRDAPHGLSSSWLSYRVGYNRPSLRYIHTQLCK